jgi:hypothetical protein
MRLLLLLFQRLALSLARGGLGSFTLAAAVGALAAAIASGADALATIVAWQT